MATEKLKFKLELYATMWDLPPKAELSINNKIFFSDDIKGTFDKPTVIEHEEELDAGEHKLILNRGGKTGDQTKIDRQTGEVLSDQLLHIKSLEIDEIEIGALIYEGVYTPVYPEPWATQQAYAGIELEKSFKNATILGHNGTWTFKFASPFYMWLLENLY